MQFCWSDDKDVQLDNLQAHTDWLPKLLPFLCFSHRQSLTMLKFGVKAIILPPYLSFEWMSGPHCSLANRQILAALMIVSIACALDREVPLILSFPHTIHIHAGSFAKESPLFAA